jgi:hypothetical protein
MTEIDLISAKTSSTLLQVSAELQHSPIPFRALVSLLSAGWGTGHGRAPTNTKSQ